MDDLPIFVKWAEFVDWFVDITDKFPKKVRWSLTNRLENHAYDILECIVKARFESGRAGKIETLRQINVKLDMMRILLRHAHRKQFLSIQAYEKTSRDLHETGQMVGGWVKQQRGNNEADRTSV